MKFAILIGDGMGDRPVASLGGKTPLRPLPSNIGLRPALASHT